MRDASLPSIPWQVTGNHWVSLPCVHPVDGSVHALGILHRGARAAVEFAGGAGFLTGDAPALARPVLTVDGARIELARMASRGSGRSTGFPPSPRASATSSSAGRCSPHTALMPTLPAPCTRWPWRTGEPSRAP